MATTLPLKEPSWHRRERKHRAAARFLLRAIKARNLLTAHHSSDPPLGSEVDELPMWNTVCKGRGKNSFEAATKGKSKGKGFPWHGFQQPMSPFAQMNQLQMMSPFMNAINSNVANGAQFSNASPFANTNHGFTNTKYAAASSFIDWQCPDCGASHPGHHTTCWDCGDGSSTAASSKSYKNKGKGKGGAKNQNHQPGRAGRWRSKKYNNGYNGSTTKGNESYRPVDADEPMGERFDIGTPNDETDKVDKEKLNDVIKWLQGKGVSQTIIGTLSDLNPPDVSQPPPRDPWRSLQSSKDKLKKIDKELTEAKDYLDSQHRKVEAAEAWHDDLCDKRTFYENEVLTLQEEVGSSELVSKAHYYESLIRKLQEKFQNGVPDSSGDLKDVYNLGKKRVHLRTKLCYSS